MCQIEAARLIIPETLFDAQAPALFSQASPTSDWIGDQGDHFGLAFLVGRPSDRYMGLQLGFPREPPILKITVAVHRHPMVPAV